MDKSSIDERITELEKELQETLDTTPIEILSVTKTKKGNDRVRTNHTKIISQYTKKINSLKKYGVEDFHQSEEYKKKMKESHNSEEYKNKIKKNPWDDPAYREKMSKLRKEIYNTEEYKTKRSNISKNRSKEANEKIRNKLIGQKRTTLESIQTQYPNIKILEYEYPWCKVICPTCKKEYRVRYYRLRDNWMCPSCVWENQGPGFTTQEVQSWFNDITLLGEYTGIHKNIKWQCNTCGYIGYTSPCNLKAGVRSCKCTPKSQIEMELLDWVRSTYTKGQVIHNSRTAIKPLEVDIYIPDEKVAIEYNGNYWHSSLCKERKYHLNKYKLCEENDIRLIQVWEYEWKDPRKREILKSIIKSALNISDVKVDARKCEFNILESKDVQLFINQNNLHGMRDGQKAFCLFYEGELVQCMLLGKSTFYKKGYKNTGESPYEILRATTKMNTQVRGGTSRLLKHIEEYVGNSPLLYFVDLDHFNGSGIRGRDKWSLERIQPSIKVWWKEEDVVKNRDSYNYKYFKEQEALGKAIILYTAGTAKYVYNWEIS